jgi:formylglycine-generating enzyme required for sulfatase activity
VYVPPGPFLCGGDEALFASGRPLHSRWVDGFLASVMPVSVREWKAWLDGLGGRR